MLGISLVNHHNEATAHSFHADSDTNTNVSNLVNTQWNNKHLMTYYPHMKVMFHFERIISQSRKHLCYIKAHSLRAADW